MERQVGLLALFVAGTRAARVQVSAQTKRDACASLAPSPTDLDLIVNRSRKSMFIQVLKSRQSTTDDKIR